MAVFGFLQDGDLTPLRVKDIDLDMQLRIQKERNDNMKAEVLRLTDRVRDLEKYCYNIGGDVALLRRKVIDNSDAEGFGITVH